jgi:hypothetical protein
VAKPIGDIFDERATVAHHPLFPAAEAVGVEPDNE